MKKKGLLFTLLMLASTIVIAQETVTLTFTANSPGNFYHPFSKVNVTNVTRGWSETLVYPDTVMILTNTTNIGESDIINKQLEVYPNPFSNQTNATFQMEETGLASFMVFNLNGEILASEEGRFEQGKHNLSIVLEKPQMAFLVVITPHGRQITKLIHTGQGSRNGIELSDRQRSDDSSRRTIEIGDFEPGDIMSYEAIFDDNGILHFSFPLGSIRNTFSVSESTQICFSQGNLQYKASNGTWRFANNQYDYIGYDNGNISATYNGWIDLFGWGTSGYHNDYDNFNVNYQPYSSSMTVVNPDCNVYGYGPSTNMPEPNLTGVNSEYDWGMYNRITNGCNQIGMWRVLTLDEWNYLFNTRDASTIGGTTNARFIKSTVNEIKGIIIFPDTYIHPGYLPYPLQINNANANFSVNSYSSEAWEMMEEQGCVFLPITGYRDGTTFGDADYYGGFYWSPLHQDASKAYSFEFDNETILFNHASLRRFGFSVRLVCPLE